MATIDKRLGLLRLKLHRQEAESYLLAAEETRATMDRLLDRRLVAMRGEAA